MKNFYKVILILMLPLLVEIVISCCNCTDTTFINYTNCSLNVFNLDNSGSAIRISQSDTLSKEAYGIRISIYRSENTCELIRNNTLFIQSVSAIHCSCPPEFEYLPLDSIVSVSIITKNDFDAEHLKSSDVTEYFYVTNGSGYISFKGYFDNIIAKISDYFETAYELDLLLMTPPNIGAEHQFEINVELSDGRNFNNQTRKIILN